MKYLLLTITVLFALTASAQLNGKGVELTISESEKAAEAMYDAKGTHAYTFLKRGANNEIAAYGMWATAILSTFIMSEFSDGDGNGPAIFFGSTGLLFKLGSIHNNKKAAKLMEAAILTSNE